MNKSEVIEFAKEYIHLKNKESTIADFKWTVSDPVETEHSWFFNYEYELSNQNINIAFGGAPGFTINKENGKISDINWDEYHKLNIPE